MKENQHIYLQPNDKIVEIRNGDALPLKHPILVNLIGSITAPAEYYQKRKDLIDPKNCHIIYSETRFDVKLVTKETDPNETAIITGQLTVNPIIEKFGINKEKMRTIQELKQFLKMNRFFFSDRDQNMKIVTELEKFNASVKTQIEQHGTNRGDKRNLTDITVDTNLAHKFDLSLPIFVGQDTHKFEVEICFNVKDASVTTWLESAELQQLIQSTSQSIIKNALAPFVNDFVVIQQP